MMNSIEKLAIGKMVNGSQAMFARRQRILREARRMISSGGLEAFNIRTLSRQADVSTRTIYNAFGSKEMVIALAIYAYFDAFFAHVHFEEAARNFDGALARQITSTLRDLDIPHYVKALVALYFSQTLHPDIRAVLLHLASQSWVSWLQILRTRRQLERGVNVSDLILDLANLQFAKIHEWCLGTIDDESFLTRTLSAILLLLSGATRGPARASVNAAYSNLQSDTPFRRQLLQSARHRITSMEIEVSARTTPVPPGRFAQDAAARQSPKRMVSSVENDD